MNAKKGMNIGHQPIMIGQPIPCARWSTYSKAIWVVFLLFASFGAFANSKYFMLYPGAQSGFYSKKYATAALACKAAQAEDQRELATACCPPDPTTGTFTFTQWPDETVPADLAHETPCTFNFVGANASGDLHFNTMYHWFVIAGACPSNDMLDSVTNQCVPGGFFVKAVPDSGVEPAACCANAIAHPINPANGAVVDAAVDVQSSSNALVLGRIYSSAYTGSNSTASGWRQSFSRHIEVIYQSARSSNFAASDPSVSSLYSDPATACTNGFAQIQSQVPTWAGGVASYSGGHCQVTKNSVEIATLPVYSTGGASESLSLPTEYDVVRDDGQLIRFVVQNGVIVAPLSVTLTLTTSYGSAGHDAAGNTFQYDSNGVLQTVTSVGPPGTDLVIPVASNGYTLKDANNNVEQYDANGRLLSVTNQTGVVQTMDYDAMGRLNSVVDSFGRKITFNYDTQNHLVSVIRQ